MAFDAKGHLVNYVGQGQEDRIPEDWYKFIKQPNIKVLEVGFGKGSLLKLLSYDGGPDLYGLDASQYNYRNARNALQVKASLALHDVSNDLFPFPDGEMDVIILMETAEHLENPIHCFKEISRVLKKDGVFIYSFPEERLISGIGIECNEKNRRYDYGYHAYFYPGFFQYKYQRTMLNQLFFKIEDEKLLETYHMFFLCKNMKLNFPEIGDVINIDVNGDEIYNQVRTEPKLKELL